MIALSIILDCWLWEKKLGYVKNDEKSSSSWPSLASLGSSGFPRWSFERRSSYWHTHPTLGKEYGKDLQPASVSVETCRHKQKPSVSHCGFPTSLAIAFWMPKLEFHSRHVTTQEGWSPQFFKLNVILWDLAHFRIENYEGRPLKADPAPLSSAASGILEAGSPSNQPWTTVLSLSNAFNVMHFLSLLFEYCSGGTCLHWKISSLMQRTIALASTGTDTYGFCHLPFCSFEMAQNIIYPLHMRSHVHESYCKGK